jgi:hypothetical protein
MSRTTFAGCGHELWRLVVGWNKAPFLGSHYYGPIKIYHLTLSKTKSELKRLSSIGVELLENVAKNKVSASSVVVQKLLSS